MTAITLSDMDCYTLLLLSSVVVVATAWSAPFHAIHRPLRITRYAPVPHRIPVPIQFPVKPIKQEISNRPKRGHRDDDDHEYDHEDHDYDHNHKETSGVTGPVHTFVKTDKNANYKWGVRHHVGNQYAS